MIVTEPYGTTIHSVNGLEMAKVYIINHSGHDFSAAEKFGELVVMTRGTVDKFRLTEMLRIFTPFIEESTKGDFILQSGPSVIACIACSAFAAKHGRLNLLIWRADREKGDHYVLRSLLFPDYSGDR